MSDGQVTEWSYSDLWTLSSRIYAGLLATGLKAGDKVIFQMHSNPDILSALWACQMGGLIPVIVEVPTIFQSGNQAMDRVIGLLELLQNPQIVADETAASAYAQADAKAFHQEPRICSIEELRKFSPEDNIHISQPDDIAFFNLSSGSTGIPKCIMLTHRNLLSRAYGANQLCGYSDTDVILNWLPFDHIGSISDWHIRCVLLGCDLIYADKNYVLGNPINWLNLIDQYRVSHSWAPNFAFALITKQLEVIQPPNWDLSCVKGLLSAGEAVSDSSVQGFIRALGKFGLNQMAVQPAFGMAELGSGITYFVPSETNPLRFHIVLKPSMGSTIERVDENHPAATRFADLGPPIPGVSLRIVDNDGNVLPMDTVGRLEIRGDVVFQGYYNNPAANASAFQTEGWFNTGDLGFLSQGNLVLTGREKETIIIKGANFYSHEIEDSATQIEGVAPSYTAASGVRRNQDSEEKLAIFFVPNQTCNETDLIRTLRIQIANRFGISPTYLISLEKHQIPKTAIGKIQRTQLKQRLEAGEFDEIIKRIDLILGNANTLPSWFYRSIWIPKQAHIVDQQLLSGATMILMDGSGLGNALSNRIQILKQTCVAVTPGSRFERKDDHHYEINFHSKSDWIELFRWLNKKHVSISQLVSLIDYQATENPPEIGQQNNDEGPLNVAAFLNMIQAIAETESAERLKRLFWVSSDCQCISSDDLGSPLKAMMSGFTKSLRFEQPALECSHIDLSSGSHAVNHDLLFTELNTFTKEKLVCYRNKQRYVSRLEKLDLIYSKASPFELKQGGFYVITGGLGGLGFELSRMLGLRHKAKLLILGRSPIEEKNSQQFISEPSNQHKQRFQKLLDDKIKCIYAQADVCNQEAVLDQIKQAEMTWGQSIDGIFHLAGIAKESPLDKETVESFCELAHPKCQGIGVLGEALKMHQGAFLVAFSSVNATFGGSNTGSYSAANVYMEAYCRQLFRSGFPALCYAWSLWDGIGMSHNTATKQIAATKGFRSISLEEGLNSLSAAMQSGQSEALIGLDASKNPIQMLIANSCYEQESIAGFLELNDSNSSDSIPESICLQDRFGTTVDCHLETISSLPLTEDGKVDKAQLISLLSHDQKTKKKPENEVEASLVELWRDLLQVNDIGTQDNFFELGGDSLLTVQLVVTIGKTFKQQIPASAIFHAPTVEQLAKLLTSDKSAPDFFSLIPYKAAGSKAPLFIVQTNCRVLVSFLDEEQPAYGLNYGVGAATIKNMLELPESVEDLAAHYVREIRLFQPEGPYFLLGHSAAGLVAYEMAQQLVAQNQAVGMLAMIDTWYFPDRIKAPTMSLREKLVKFSKLSLKEIATFFQKKLASRYRKFKRRFFKNEYTKNLFIRSRHLYPRYIAKPYPGKISYFKCTKQSTLQPEGNYEQTWENFAQKGMRLHLIPCHHDEILSEPNVKLLAEKITQDLNETNP
jgi:acyl-CoA synthetase (AMP-forming)/AMP-acid ligase II/thioesterase domain-containing protein/acyl carrier protein/NADP-dependent 3-hydroxy acid dehydrogenase YdfG